MIPLVELHVWRAIRALTFLSILVTMLMIGGQAVSMLKALLPPAMPTAIAQQVVQAPQASQSSTAQSVAPPGVRVQTFAEIVPGADRRTASAWADGATMETQSIATGEELKAEAAAAWPEQRLLLVMTPTSVSIQVTATADRSPVFVPAVPLANARSGPGTEYPILEGVSAGRRLSIKGRYGQWWQVDLGYALGWIFDGVGTATGDLTTVPLVEGVAPPPVIIPTTPSATATPLPTATPAFAYSVEVERHPEANTVSFYGRVQDGQNIAGGLYLWITHNGKTYRSEPSSHLIAGMTKPSDPDSQYNDNYNVKIDFPPFIYHDVDPVGEWTVTLVDGNNQALSNTTRVQVAPADGMKEFFVAYRKP